jgi:hypothetical protein
MNIIKGFGMLMTVIICFIDQRFASFLYNQYRDQLQIHKRWFGKICFTTLIVLCQIIFDKNCTISKKNHFNTQTDKKELSAHHTELTTFELPSNPSTSLTPSFNLRSNKKSTPNRPIEPTNRTFAPTPSKRIFAPSLESTHTVEIHKEHDDSDTDEQYHTACDM